MTQIYQNLKGPRRAIDILFGAALSRLQQGTNDMYAIEEGDITASYRHVFDCREFREFREIRVMMNKCCCFGTRGISKRDVRFNCKTVDQYNCLL